MDPFDPDHSITPKETTHVLTARRVLRKIDSKGSSNQTPRGSSVDDTSELLSAYTNHDNSVPASTHLLHWPLQHEPSIHELTLNPDWVHVNAEALESMEGVCPFTAAQLLDHPEGFSMSRRTQHEAGKNPLIHLSIVPSLPGC